MLGRACATGTCDTQTNLGAAPPAFSDPLAELELAAVATSDPARKPCTGVLVKVEGWVLRSARCNGCGAARPKVAALVHVEERRVVGVEVLERRYYCEACATFESPVWERAA